MKINTKQLLLSILLLLPITTLLQGFFPAINRILFICVILLLLIVVLRKAYSKWEYLALIGFAVCVIVPTLMTQGPIESINLYFYYPFFILFCLYVAKDFNYFFDYCKNQHNYIKKVVFVWCLIVFISLFFKTSYKDGYFFSFTGNVFRSATAASFILALVLILSVTDKKCALFSVMPMLCIFTGGSRTYLAIDLAMMVVLLYIVVPSIKAFWRWLIPMGIVAVIVLFNSSIISKIVDTLTVSPDEFFQDPLVQFTSGRSIFWEAEVREFANLNFIRQWLGSGHNFVYDVNEQHMGVRIWAHNDFFHILLTHGILGLILYIYFFVKMFKTCTASLKLPWYINALLVFIWLFNAFFNMHYTYVCASASYPFILVAVSLTYKIKQERALLRGNAS